jgi:hypothetical protein
VAKLVDPAGVSRPPARRLAPRLETLAGIRLGLLDNAKPNADAVLGAMAERLRAEQGVSEVVRFRKKNPGMGASEEVLAALAACDAVLLGTSD